MACKARKKSFKCTGFSLLEMMAVLLIIGLLAGIVTLNVRGFIVSSRQKKAMADIATLKDGIETYYAIKGRYPTNEEGINALTQKQEDTGEPIVDEIPKDPWGNEYQYRVPGPDNYAFEVISLGADNLEGGEGDKRDIANWNLKDTMGG